MDNNLKEEIKEERVKLMTKKQEYGQIPAKKRSDYDNNNNENYNQRQNREQNQRKGNNYNIYSKNKGRSRSLADCANSKHEKKSKADETINDIKEDIIRIEKEIRLEINEIRSLKLGL
ncbi:MAG: hypothetical protein HPY74_03415 [Firmicutes bacterium]|nr:hypothetical protein [Bacillota bacterium]